MYKRQPLDLDTTGLNVKGNLYLYLHIKYKDTFNVLVLSGFHGDSYTNLDTNGSDHVNKWYSGNIHGCVRFLSVLRDFSNSKASFPEKQLVHQHSFAKCSC